MRLNGFDQNGRANRALRNSKLILRKFESVVPNARLQMALHFWQIKVWAAASSEELLRSMEKVEAEIEETSRNRFAIDEHVFLEQMPAARVRHEDRELLV